MQQTTKYWTLRTEQLSHLQMLTYKTALDDVLAAMEKRYDKKKVMAVRALINQSVEQLNEDLLEVLRSTPEAQAFFPKPHAK